ncbi:hypothetical protein HDV00_006103 [Rhizophlyctis rosea]|nr:hypothetical protein HDV00_006103 [Rhizophlyctis rosea]
MLAGIAFGPVGVNLLNPFTWGTNVHVVTQQFAQLLIAIQIMAAAVALPKACWTDRWKGLAILLGPVMVWMWLATALCLWLILRISWYDAMIIAACTAPTDPVLANSIVSGRFADMHIPVPVRTLLSAESAANDGLAVPLFDLGVLFRDMPVKDAIVKWIWHTWLYQVALAAVVGAVIGYAARRGLRYAEEKNLIDKRSFLSFEIALAAFIVGLGTMIHIAAFLSVFFAGLVFAWDGWFTEETDDAHVQEVIDMLFNLAFFVYFGATLQWETFNTEQLPLWRLVVCALVILIMRRLPIVFALYRYMPGIFTYTEGIMVGWFGPIGVGALWYMAAAKEHYPDNELFLPIVNFIVFLSVIVYGITAPFIHFTVLGISTLSRTIEMRVPTWPANVPIDASAISGPIIRVVTADNIRDIEDATKMFVDDDPSYGVPAEWLSNETIAGEEGMGVMSPMSATLEVPRTDSVGMGMTRRRSFSSMQGVRFADCVGEGEKGKGKEGEKEGEDGREGSPDRESDGDVSNESTGTLVNGDERVVGILVNNDPPPRADHDPPPRTSTRSPPHGLHSHGRALVDRDGERVVGILVNGSTGGEGRPPRGARRWPPFPGGRGWAGTPPVEMTRRDSDRIEIVVSPVPGRPGAGRRPGGEG